MLNSVKRTKERTLVELGLSIPACNLAIFCSQIVLTNSKEESFCFITVSIKKRLT